MKNCHWFQILPFLLLIAGLHSAYQAVNWAHIPEIKSGDCKLLLQPLPSSPYSVSQGYGTGFTFTPPPNVVIAMRSMAIDATNQSIDFTISVGSITSSQFTATIVAPGGLPITLLYYMYIAMSTSYSYTYFLSYTIDLTAQLNNGLTLNASVSRTVNASIAQYSSARVMPYFISFAMGANSTEYSVATTAAMTSPTTFSVLILSNSSLSRIELMVIIVDVYSYEAGYKNFLDYGYLQEFNSGASYSQNFAPPASDYYNLIAGMTSLRLPRQKAISFYLMTNNLYNTTTAYTQLKAEILQWRLRQCINSSLLFFAPPEGQCYDNCSNSIGHNYGENTTFSFCAECSLSCKKCKGDGVSCTACESADNRVLNNSTQTCDCLGGYFNQNGYKGCLACDYSCLTCVNSSTTCLSCASGRTLSSRSCPCNAGTYDSLTGNATCLACDYKCATCQSASANCTTCSPTTNRIFDSQNLKCPCGSGFMENGTSVCISTPLICSSPCVSCVAVADNCTSCDANNARVLASNQCICKDGFTSTSVTGCIEICGDGKLLTNTYQCDDGNTISGDGCSSACVIESGFNCINSNTAFPASTCTSDGGYSISFNNLIRDAQSNQMTATVSFSPTPPSTIVPSLQNLQGQLALSSYSFDSASSTITLRIDILQEISASSLSISFSVINQTTAIPLQATNNLELKPYSSFQLSVYKIENYLIWGFIGFLWVGSIIFVGFVDVRSFNGIFQLFMFVSLAWVGVEGQQLYSLLFLPLKNLRYIYGMNLQLGSQDSLFSVFNIGCVLFALPFLGFVIIMLINKRQAYSVSTRIKRFVLFDLLYGWLMINGFLIAYGLGITAKLSRLNAFDIGGIVFGAVYLLACFVSSYRLFTRKKEVQINPKLAISKKNLFRPHLYSLTTNLYLIFALLYLSISKSLKINAIVMIGVLFLVFLLFALGNILISKIKYMLNLVFLIFIYGCVMLYNNVSNAVWSGLAVTALLYLQLALNFTFLLFEKGRRAGDSTDNSDTVKVDYELNQMKLGVDVEREPEFDELEHSENKSALEGQYENHFTVYEPTIKKPPLEIMINPPEMLYETNAINTAIKTFTGRSEKERLLLDKRQNYLVTPRPRKEVEEEIIDIGSKEVEMDAI